MNEFIEIPATKKSLGMRKLIHGLGVNDSIYLTENIIDGKRFACPFYVKWKSMLERCYSEKYQMKMPTYKGCYVCDEWLIFSNFKAWMSKQDWHGKQLDKDILVQGNKIYSPSTCIFVTQNINTLTSDNKAKRGKFPVGVNFDKQKGKYEARFSVNGRSVRVGNFLNPSDAFEAYKIEKYKHISSIAIMQSEPLRSALLNYKIK